MHRKLMGFATAGSAVFLAASANGATLVADYGFQGGDPLASSSTRRTGFNYPEFRRCQLHDANRRRTDAAGRGCHPWRWSAGQTDAILPNNNYSIVLLANFNAVNSGSTNNTELVLGKAIDFQNRTSDSGLYPQGGALDFYDGTNSSPLAEGDSIPGGC